MAKRGPYRKKPLWKRFWTKVRKTKGCWLWTAGTNNHGYGLIGLSIPGAKKGMVLAHRVSFLLHHGGIPDGAFVLHDCDVPRCVRPDHLYLGDQQRNMADMARRGRTVSKLSRTDVIEIRERYSRRGTTQATIAQDYGVHPSLISLIVLRKAWRHT